MVSSNTANARGRVALAFAALLLSGSAFAAGSVDGAQAQAGALLSAAPGSRTAGASTSLPAADSPVSSIQAHEQARRLIARMHALSGANRGMQAQASNTAGYAGAQESARRMILGRGA